MIEWIGMIAGTLTTISFLPQVLKIWRTRDVKSISILMYLLFSFGVFLWILYGIAMNSLPLIIFNLITFFLAICVLGLKIKIEIKHKLKENLKR